MPVAVVEPPVVVLVELLLPPQPERLNAPTENRASSRSDAGRMRLRRKNAPTRPAARTATPPRCHGLRVGCEDAIFVPNDWALADVQFDVAVYTVKVDVAEAFDATVTDGRL